MGTQDESLLSSASSGGPYVFLRLKQKNGRGEHCDLDLTPGVPTHGHLSEDAARERLKRAYLTNVAPLTLREARSQSGRERG